ncbi:MAG: hypothetical protein ABH952_07860 [Candidatus Omnitrophota bacterium]
MKLLMACPYFFGFGEKSFESRCERDDFYPEIGRLSQKMPGANPAARKDIAHFGLERGAQEMEGVYRGVAE